MNYLNLEQGDITVCKMKLKLTVVIVEPDAVDVCYFSRHDELLMAKALLCFKSFVS